MSVPRNPRPAATVLVLRDASAGPEIFMVRRHAGAAFMAGAHVFPGGRVDPADALGADSSWCDGLEQADVPPMTREAAVAHRLGAIRELFEEAGILLACDPSGRFASLSEKAVHERFAGYRLEVHGGTLSLRELCEREGLRLKLDALVPFARWVTPPVDSRQFDAWFFVARMPPDQVPAHDNTETTHGDWIRAADALARTAQGTMLLAPPTWTSLREIEGCATVDAALVWAAGRRIEPREPAVVEVDGESLLILPGDPLNPTPWHEPVPAETRFRRSSGGFKPVLSRS